jgi:hypothetical protein
LAGQLGQGKYSLWWTSDNGALRKYPAFWAVVAVEEAFLQFFQASKTVLAAAQPDTR